MLQLIQGSAHLNISNEAKHGQKAAAKPITAATILA
jgi:hypothetical protein